MLAQIIERLGLRGRRPYVARHTSVSWNLMVGKNPLFVARQHGHSVATMFRTYAALDAGCPRIRNSTDPIRHESEEISAESEAWAGVSFANRASAQIGHWKHGL